MYSFVRSVVCVFVTLLQINDVSSLYIVANNSVRLVSSESDCSEGLIQVYNNGHWGSIAQCDGEGLSEYDYDWICEKLGFTATVIPGFNSDNSAYSGTKSWLSHSGSEIISNFSFEYPNISYTDIDCDFKTTVDSICEGCTMTYKSSSCNNYNITQIIENYFSFVRCDTSEYAIWRDCQFVSSLTDWANDYGNVTNCDDLQYVDTLDEVDILLYSMVGAGACLVCTFIIFQVIRRYRTNKRNEERLERERKFDEDELKAKQKRDQEQKSQKQMQQQQMQPQIQMQQQQQLQYASPNGPSAPYGNQRQSQVEGGGVNATYQ